MAKNKKAASSSSSYGKKKAITITGKKTLKKVDNKIDNKKVEIISEKLSRINRNFESLILECQNALHKLSHISA